MKTYYGHRTEDGTLLVTVRSLPRLAQRRLKPWLQIRNHSPTGFECGYEGSGPAQLALAILVDYLQDTDAAVELYHKFKRDCIAHLPKDRDWTLTGPEIHQQIWKHP